MPESHDRILETPAIAAWRHKVAAEGGNPWLSGLASRDGIPFGPLWRPRSDTASIAGRGARPWAIVQPVDNPDPDDANAQARRDLEGGATGLALRFAGAASSGRFGLPLDGAALEMALDGVDVGAIHIRLDPHPRIVETARHLRDLIAKSGLASERADAAFGLDPIGPAAALGSDPPDAKEYVKCFAELRVAGHRGPIAELDGRVFHEAGATEAQELAVVLASAAWWLRSLDAASMPIDDALPCFGATLSVDRDQFLSIAKLRAMRLLWARLLEVCGAPRTPLKLHAETSRRMMTSTDPHSNLLRTTIAAFAAAIGGADSMTVLPHTSSLGLPDRAARALARNIQHLLLEESRLHLVEDTAAGSGAVEALTDDLARIAWDLFQAIEARGGIVESLRTGLLQEQVSATRSALAAMLAKGRDPLVGATVYRSEENSAGSAAAAVESDAHRNGLIPISLEALAKVHDARA